MFNADVLTFQEFVMREPLPLATIQETMLELFRGRPKAGTDWRDLAVLLLKFPELKNEDSPVTASLQRSGASENVLQVWRELVEQEIKMETEDEDLEF